MSDDDQLGGGSLPATDEDEASDNDNGDLLAGERELGFSQPAGSY